ncbi:MAG: hypothetical protein IKX00_01225 [Bacilli bacterium]|nr:hypothetical protein [Bacilli bacterium]
MTFDLNELNNVLNVFGVSLEIKDDVAIFIDNKSNSIMESYIVCKEGFADQERHNAADTKTLFNGYPFYIKTKDLFLKLSIYRSKDKFMLTNISKVETIEPHKYEYTEMHVYGRSYELNEYTWVADLRKDGSEYLSGKTISLTSFHVLEPINQRFGRIQITNGKKKTAICYGKDIKTGEIKPYADFDQISKNNCKKLIDESRVFKETLKIFCPIVSSYYFENEIDNVRARN